MKRNIFIQFILFAAIGILSFSCKTNNDSIESKIDEILSKMTLEEKISMLSGDSTGFNSAGISRLGIPPIKMADGPVGVRVGTSTAFPVSVNMAASWDTALINRYGIALAEEVKAKGKTCILGPCVGIHRFPLNGRNFESFSEDPYLASRMVVNYIKGVQSQNVIATLKHFACNDQEWERNSYDVQVDERTMREIHLAPFEAGVKEADALAVMSSYNLVNGQHSSENKQLLNDILKTEWGFKGIVMSDWVSVYSADKAAYNGLDVEMPKAIWYKDSLMAAIKSGKVTESTIDDKIRRHLRVRFKTGYMTNPLPVEDESVIKSENHKDLALEMAQKSIILAKNENILPLSENNLKTIALIGPHSLKARSGGGGSSTVNPWHSVSPYDGIKELVGNKVIINTAEGVMVEPFASIPIPGKYLQTNDGKPGLTGEYFNNPRFEGTPALVRIDTLIDFSFDDGSPAKEINNDNFSIRWKGKFTPPKTGLYNLVISSDDGSLLFIDGKQVVDNWGNHGEQPRYSEIELTGGKAYDIRIDFNEAGGGACMRLKWKDPSTRTTVPTIEEAVKVAKSADVAILCVGNSMFTEGEGADVADFLMSDRQEDLVKAVVNANPNTIIVVYGGVPVYMKNWIDKVKAVIIAGYPGQEGGTALAQILFGKVNPSAKLTYSYVQERTESPAFIGYKDPGLKVNYAEGVFVGYRYYEKNNITPLFPFGFGLSYTTFEYKNLKVEKNQDNGFTASFEITNTGKMDGGEVAQLYVAPSKSEVERPKKEMKGFSKVFLKVGETKTVSIKLNGRAFSYFHPQKKQWVAEKGKYEILIGASSKDIKLNGVAEL